MYEGDTFFHLSVPGRIGLVVLSIILASGTFYVLWRMSSRFVWPVKVLFAMVMLWFFIWLSPQVYYMYYLLIFEGLPLQIVIGKPPSAAELLSILTFTGKPDLSSHGKGLLGWILLLVSFITRARNRDPG